MKKFLTFINEQYEPIRNGEKGKLTIETDDIEDVNWKLIISLEKMWNEYSENKLSLIDFNKKYSKLLINNKDIIIENCGVDAWNSMVPYINDMMKSNNIEDSEKLYEHLYDVYDKYDILLKISNNEDQLIENFEQQDFSVGDIIVVDFNNEKFTAKITKINSKNSYLIKVEENGVFDPKEYEIGRENIIDIVSPDNSPANTTDWNQPLKQKPSNDFAINGNGTPGVPAPGSPFN